MAGIYSDRNPFQIHDETGSFSDKLNGCGHCESGFFLSVIGSRILGMKS